jgi:hypothetical protein
VEIKTLLVIAHVLSAVFGVGGALMLDLHLLRHMRGRPLRLADVALVEFLGRFVKGGVIGLWATGILIMSLAPDGPTSVFAVTKVQAKLVIVVVLTLNALFIETLALPLIKRNAGRCLFDGVDEKQRSLLIAFGVTSGVSWLLPFVLGLAKELNAVPAGEILAAYALFLIVGTLFAQAAVRLAYRLGRIREANIGENGLRMDWSGRAMPASRYVIPPADFVAVPHRERATPSQGSAA